MQDSLLRLLHRPNPNVSNSLWRSKAFFYGDRNATKLDANANGPTFYHVIDRPASKELQKYTRFNSCDTTHSSSPAQRRSRQRQFIKIDQNFPHSFLNQCWWNLPFCQQPNEHGTPQHFARMSFRFAVGTAASFLPKPRSSQNALRGPIHLIKDVNPSKNLISIHLFTEMAFLIGMWEIWHGHSSLWKTFCQPCVPFSSW